jgi:branched-chain amino acid transport system substrate-binding protein
MRRYLSVLVAVLLAVALVGSISIGNEEEPVSIGILLPITGTQAVMSEDLLAGFEIAQEQINAAGGVLGRPLELIIEDTETRPAPGMDAARKLVEIDNVPVISGGFSSGVAGE